MILFLSTAGKLLRLSPTAEQKKIFGNWTDVSRWVSDRTMDFIRSCMGFAPHWMEIKKYATRFLPAWTRPVPFQIKGIAIREVCDAFWKAIFQNKKKSLAVMFYPENCFE